jgi:hypothetical protein
MFVEKKLNKSGSTSVRIMQKVHGRRRCVKVIGCSSDIEEIGLLVKRGNRWIEEHRNGMPLFELEDKAVAYDTTVTIDHNKIAEDTRLDGLKGYVTNSKIKDEEVAENYRNLHFIERAFRMNKTDLAIRPIYHRPETLTLDLGHPVAENRWIADGTAMATGLDRVRMDLPYPLSPFGSWCAGIGRPLGLPGSVGKNDRDGTRTPVGVRGDQMSSKMYGSSNSTSFFRSMSKYSSLNDLLA